MKFKVNEYHLLCIKRRLELLPVEYANALCKKYSVSDIECLNATDYDEILETISDHFAEFGNMINNN